MADLTPRRLRMPISVTVRLLSGKEATVEAGADEEVGTLKCRAQTALGVGRGRLLDAAGSILDVRGSIKQASCMTATH